jgi:hypothetical protein
MSLGIDCHRGFLLMHRALLLTRESQLGLGILTRRERIIARSLIRFAREGQGLIREEEFRRQGFAESQVRCG